MVVDAVLAAPLSGLPPQDGGADKLNHWEDDEADAGREEREEPEESGWRFNGIDFDQIRKLLCEKSHSDL